jgi:sulfur carrier protein
VTILLNGQPRKLRGETSVAAVVALLGVDARRGVAVALDGEVVPRSKWETTRVRDGQAVEVLQAVQGG